MRGGIDRVLNFVAGWGDGGVYADSIRAAAAEQLDLLYYSMAAIRA